MVNNQTVTNFEDANKTTSLPYNKQNAKFHLPLKYVTNPTPTKTDRTANVSTDVLTQRKREQEPPSTQRRRIYTKMEDNNSSKSNQIDLSSEEKDTIKKENYELRETTPDYFNNRKDYALDIQRLSSMEEKTYHLPKNIQRKTNIGSPMSIQTLSQNLNETIDQNRVSGELYDKQQKGSMQESFINKRRKIPKEGTLDISELQWVKTNNLHLKNSQESDKTCSNSNMTPLLQQLEKGEKENGAQKIQSFNIQGSRRQGHRRRTSSLNKDTVSGMNTSNQKLNYSPILSKKISTKQKSVPRKVKQINNRLITRIQEENEKSNHSNSNYITPSFNVKGRKFDLEGSSGSFFCNDSESAYFYQKINSVKVSDTLRYIGPVEEGLFHGYGRLVTIRGEIIYEGEFEKGKYHGRGKLWNYALKSSVDNSKDLKNEVFSNYVDSQRNSYRNDLQLGICLLNVNFTDSNWEFYRGYFDSGKKQGFGKLQLTDGKVFKGDFSQGFAEGYGVLKYGPHSLPGMWSENKLIHFL